MPNQLDSANPSLLRGILAPTLTPVHADLSPDIERWVSFSKDLLANGCEIDPSFVSLGVGGFVWGGLN